MAIKIIRKTINTELANEIQEVQDFLSDKHSLCSHLINSMETYGEDKAVTDEHNKVELNYSEVVSKIKKVASAIQKAGINHKTHISFFSENNGSHFIVTQGILYAGCTVVLRGTSAPADELEYILDHSDSEALFISDYKALNAIYEVLQKKEKIKFVCVLFEKGTKPEGLKMPVYTLNEFIADADENIEEKENSIDDVAAMLYSSGTTGYPKGVMLTHGNILSQLKTFREGLGVKRGEKSLQILPIWHSYEFTAQTIHYATGMHLHFTTIPALRNDLKKYNVDVFMTVPRIWQALRIGIYQRLKQKSKLQYFIFDTAVKMSIMYKIHKMYGEKRITNKQGNYNLFLKCYHRLIRSFFKPFYKYFAEKVFKETKNRLGLNFRISLSGGGALSLQDELFYDTIGVNLRVAYGLTETSPVLTMRHSTDKNYLCSAGRPLKATDIKIIDPKTKEEVGIFQKGLVLVRGPQIMKGYYKNEQATNEVIDKDGWFTTGDLGWLTSNNFLVLVGRVKETIVLSNGENIEPLPIEEACLQSNYIEQIVLVGQDESSIGALIVPTQEAMEKCNIALSDIKKGSNLTIKDPQLYELIKQEINAHIKAKPNLKSFEKINKFEILKNAFNQEDGLITQSGKMKRNKVYDKYKSIISKMFQDKK
ncbi:AMP-binding protein [bacterium]|nr:AMP-binding protein [bacterium]